MRGIKIGTAKAYDYVPLKCVSIEGKEILVVKTGKKFLRSGTSAPIWDAFCPAGLPAEG